MLPILATLPLIASFAVALLGKTRVIFAERVTMLFAVSAFVMTGYLAWQVALHGNVSFGEYFALDALSALILLIIAFVGMNVVLYSVGYLNEEMRKGIIGPSRVWQYHILLNAFLFVMFLAVTTTNPIVMWISIEATTLATAFLVSFYNKPSSLEAALKYVILNSVGLLIGFFGVILLLSSATKGLGNVLLDWDSLRVHAFGIDPLVAKTAFIFILVGFGTKVGLVPMHTWLPDAHSKAPAPISALLSGVLLNVAFLAVLRFKSIIDITLGTPFANSILLFFGLASILLVAFTIISQRNYKRLLAYSSVENMGIAALGVGLGGLAAYGVVIHLLFHSLAKSLLFLCSGSIFVKYHSTKIANVRGMFRIMPVTGTFFFLGVLAVVGMPPFAIFASKLAILTQAMNDRPYIAGLLLILFGLVFIGFIRHASLMLFGNPPEDIEQGELKTQTIIPLVVLMFVIIYLSLSMPAPLTHLIQQAALFVDPHAIF